MNNTTKKSATINRRQFLTALLAAGYAPSILARTSDTLSREYYVSAQGKDADSYSFSSVTVSDKNNSIQSVLTGFRGHGLAQNPVRKDSVILFARRPGTVCVEVNPVSGNINRTFKLAKNRNLQGHGCFSSDGSLLFTAEADSRTGEGRIVVRDTQHYKQLSEIDSYGIGPHEIRLMPDGKTLVVANGGIHTRPETGRKKLNLDTMQSSLTYIDTTSGNKLDSFQLAEPKASIRHLDVADDGTVALAMQLQREVMKSKNIVALSAIHKPGQPVQLLDEPSILIEKMNDYMGSVAINNQTRIAGFTSPKGNLAAFWNIDSGQFSGYHQLNDVCGLCVSHDNKYFIVSNSSGEIRKLDAKTLKENKAQRLRFNNIHFDNHMMAVSI